MSTRIAPNSFDRGRLPPGIYAICDDRLLPEVSPAEKARQALAGGVRVVQLRLKEMAAREAVTAARKVVALCRAHGAVCIINDRPDWAVMSGADGVHVGDEDLPPEEARAILGPGRLVGVTVRSAAMAREAARAGASYVGAGPVFATSTKAVAAPTLGIAGLSALCRESPLPVVAIGGIGRESVGQVVAAGAHGVAVLSALLVTPDIGAQAEGLCAAFESARAKGPRSAGAAR